jgi:hypothetical protein
MTRVGLDELVKVLAARDEHRHPSGGASLNVA